ncbi:MAG TPA: hypothetical protein VIL65_08210 [Beijerinckiaceae bacterium]|jgi:hypothetical protein
MTSVYRPDTLDERRPLGAEERDAFVSHEAFHERLALIKERQRAARRRDEPQKDGGLRFLLELAAVIVLALGIFYGQPYAECRRMKERGEFWYGDTIKSCMKERIARRNEAIEGAGARVVAMLPAWR